MGAKKGVSSAKLNQEYKALRLQEQKERTKFYMVLGTFVIVVVAYFLWSLGSTGGASSNPVTGYMVYAPEDQQPVCGSPYITVCCLDENSNNICDSEEDRIAQQRLVSG